MDCEKKKKAQESLRKENCAVQNEATHFKNWQMPPYQEHTLILPRVRSRITLSQTTSISVQFYFIPFTLSFIFLSSLRFHEPFISIFSQPPVCLGLQTLNRDSLQLGLERINTVRSCSSLPIHFVSSTPQLTPHSTPVATKKNKVKQYHRGESGYREHSSILTYLPRLSWGGYVGSPLT